MSQSQHGRLTDRLLTVVAAWGGCFKFVQCLIVYMLSGIETIKIALYLTLFLTGGNNSYLIKYGSVFLSECIVPSYFQLFSKCID